MPELPEVETVVRTLERQIAGKTIRSVDVRWPGVVAYPDAESFARRLAGQRFTGFSRRGKYLIFTLSGSTLIAHLRMEGRFYRYEQDTVPDRHTHLVFQLDDGQLHYHDMRKFGRFWLYGPGEPFAALSGLGPEPFDPDLKAEDLKAFCRHKTLAIKSQLLDQRMIAGIGNIYANEACFAAGIDPRHPACYLSLKKWRKLLTAVRQILAAAIAQGGSTVRDYTSQLGVTGRFQQYLNVHDRRGAPCRKCGTPIVKIQLNGRGTYYCPHCQKETALLVGLTGSIGAGKSTALAVLADLGYPVISCDAVNAELLTQPETRQALAPVLGCRPEEVTKDRLRQAIYSDGTVKKQVERYLHRRIRQTVRAFIRQHRRAVMVVVEVPLLFESGWYKEFDVCWLIRAGERAVDGRLEKQRGMSPATAAVIRAAQWPQEKKAALADVVTANDGTPGRFRAAVEKQAAAIVKWLPKD